MDSLSDRWAVSRVASCLHRHHPPTSAQLTHHLFAYFWMSRVESGNVVMVGIKCNLQQYCIVPITINTN